MKETETEAAAEETETEAADESEADLDVADDGEEGMPALQEAAIAVDDLLVREWGELRDVTYTLDENTIYVSLWADGINNETIDDVTNWDEVTNMFDYLADGCADIMKDAGLEDGLVRLHFVSDETNDAYLIYENKDVVWAHPWVVVLPDLLQCVSEVINAVVMSIDDGALGTESFVVKMVYPPPRPFCQQRCLLRCFEHMACVGVELGVAVVACQRTSGRDRINHKYGSFGLTCHARGVSYGERYCDGFTVAC